MRHCLMRWVGTFSALWSLFVIGGPANVQSCPMHPARGAAPVAASAHSGHDMAGMDHSAPSPASDKAPDQCPCHCIAGCCASASFALGFTAPSHEFAVERQPARRLPTATISAPFTRAPHSLPFSNGPPAV